MSLSKVSLTGVGLETPPSELCVLSKEFPFVEWAVLFFPERAGEGRNPSEAWRKEFLDTCSSCMTAAHLCGEKVFRDVLSKDETLFSELRRYGRLQLNINARFKLFTDEEVVAVYDTLREEGFSLILQLHADSKELVLSYMEKALSDGLPVPSLLLDESKGRGVVPGKWLSPMVVAGVPVSCGYAGGISPDNIKAVAAAVREAVSTHSSDCWLDMESGVRTNNLFDLGKAREILSVFAETN